MNSHFVGSRRVKSVIIALISTLFFILCAWTRTAEDHALTSFSNLVVATRASVVNIAVKKTVDLSDQDGTPYDMQETSGEMSGRSFKEGIPRAYSKRTIGSGFIIDRDGFILTTNHLVEDAEEIDVGLSNGHRYSATLVGRDPTDRHGPDTDSCRG